MMTDRMLARTFGMRPHAVALWGAPVRIISSAAVVLVLAGLTDVYAHALRNTVAVRHLQDFGVFYDAASRARSGEDMYPALTTARPTKPINLNPPIFHLLLRPLNVFPPVTAFAIWMAASGLSLITSLAIVIRTLRLDRWPAAALLALVYVSPAMLATLLTGQVGALLLLPYTLAWLAARRQREAAAAAWLGFCASIKPLFLLFAPAFARAGLWRATLTIASTVAVLFLLAAATVGVEPHRAWVNHLLAITWAEHYMNASLLGTIERSLSSSEWFQQPIVNAPGLVAPAWMLAAGALGIATLHRVRSVTDIDQQFLLVTTAALLISPLGWVYYLWFLIAPLCAHVVSCHEAQPSWVRWMLLGGVAGLLLPPPVVLAALGWGAGLGTLTVGSAYCWALIAIWTAAWGERPPARAAS